MFFFTKILDLKKKYLKKIKTHNFRNVRMISNLFSKQIIKQWLNYAELIKGRKKNQHFL